MSNMHEKLTVKTFLWIPSNCPFYAKTSKRFPRRTLERWVLEPSGKNINEVPEVSYPKSFEKTVCHYSPALQLKGCALQDQHLRVWQKRWKYVWFLNCTELPYLGVDAENWKETTPKTSQEPNQAVLINHWSFCIMIFCLVFFLGKSSLPSFVQQNWELVLRIGWKRASTWRKLIF